MNSISKHCERLRHNTQFNGIQLNDTHKNTKKGDIKETKIGIRSHSNWCHYAECRVLLWCWMSLCWVLWSQKSELTHKRVSKKVISPEVGEGSLTSSISLCIEWFLMVFKLCTFVCSGKFRMTPKTNFIWKGGKGDGLRMTI